MLVKQSGKKLPNAVDEILGDVEKLRATNLTAALNRANEALTVAESSGDATLIDKVLSTRAQLHSIAKNTDAALKDAERALAGHKSRGNPRGHASLLNTLAIIREDTGDYASAYLLQTECLNILRGLDFPEATAQVASNLGLTCTYVGDWDEALTHYAESLAVWERLPEQEGKGNVLVNLGFAHQTAGDLAEAEKHFRQAIDVYTRCAPEYYQINPLCNLASNALARGEIAEAEAIAREAIEKSERQEDPARKAHTLALLGNIQKARDETAQARESLQKAHAIYSEIHMPRGIVSSLRDLASVDEDDFARAENLLKEALEIARANGLKPIIVDILGDLHRLAAKSGLWEDACHYLQEKTAAEKSLQNERTSIKLKALRLETQLEHSRRETELERKRVSDLSAAMEKLSREKQRAEEESRQKSEILNFAAHDLRNLVWGITGPAEVLRTECEESASAEFLNEPLEAIIHSARTLEETLGHVLNAAAIESGTLVLSLESTHLNPLTETAFSRWSFRARAKDQTLVVMPGDEELTADIDQRHVLECMDNLISNALKYSPPGATIRMGWEKRGPSAVFSVTDEGPGLSPSDREKLGRLFQRLGPQPTGGELSVGVGLALVKRILELHGASLEVECPPSGGSVFRLVFAIP